MSNPDSTGSGDQQGSRSTRSRVRNWRLRPRLLRPRLLLFIAIPTGTAVALGGASIVSSWQSAVADQRSEALASLSTKVCQLAFQIETERDTIVWYISAGPDGRASQLSGHSYAPAKQASDDYLQVIQQRVYLVGPWIKAVAAGVAGVGSGYPRIVQLDARAVAAELRTLPNLRHQALSTQIPATDVIEEYGNLVNVLLALDDQVALSSSDPRLTSTARTMATISRYENEAAVQRAIVMYGLTAFDEQELINNTNRLASLPVVGLDWWESISSAIYATHRFEETLATSAVDRARALRERAIISAIVIGGIILLVLVFSLFLTVIVGRSMIEPPRGLNSAKRWRQPRRSDLGADVAGA